MDELILIVDDAKFARIVAKRALLNGGYSNIIEAGTAAEAIELFKANNPALTLLDITLPDSTNLGLLKKLLELSPDAKIIMNSALGQDLVIMDALEAGAKDFITKPFTEETFLRAVRGVLKGGDDA